MSEQSLSSENILPKSESDTYMATGISNPPPIAETVVTKESNKPLMGEKVVTKASNQPESDAYISTSQFEPTKSTGKFISSSCYDLFSDQTLGSESPPTNEVISKIFKDRFEQKLKEHDFLTMDEENIKLMIIKNELYSYPEKIGAKSSDVAITSQTNITQSGGKRKGKKSNKYRLKGGQGDTFEPLHEHTWMITVQILGPSSIIDDTRLSLIGETIEIDGKKYHIRKSHISNLHKLFTTWEHSDVVNDYSGSNLSIHRRSRFDRSVDYLKKITGRLRDCTEISSAYKVKHHEVEVMLVTVRKLFSLVIFLRDQIERNQLNYDTLERLILEITIAMNKDYHIPLEELEKLKVIQKKIAVDNKNLEERFRIVSNQILDRLNRAGALKENAPENIGDSFPLDNKGLKDGNNKDLPQDVADKYSKYVIPFDATVSDGEEPHRDITKYYQTEYNEHDGLTRGVGEPYTEHIDPDRVGEDTATTFGEYEPGDKAIPYTPRRYGIDSKTGKNELEKIEKENDKLDHHLSKHTINKYLSTDTPDGQSIYQKDKHARDVAIKYANSDMKGNSFPTWKKDATDRDYNVENVEPSTIIPDANPNPGMIPLEPISSKTTGGSSDSTSNSKDSTSSDDNSKKLSGGYKGMRNSKLKSKKKYNFYLSHLRSHKKKIVSGKTRKKTNHIKRSHHLKKHYN